MNGRSLRASIHRTEVGTVQEAGGLWSFQYTADWLDYPAVLLEAGAVLNLSKGTARRLLENLSKRILREAESLYREAETENAEIAHGRPELSATMAGESRCLRTILHTVIKEMAKQFA